MLKSPSFGTEFSLCCPYVYLAHYNLMKSKSGNALLKEREYRQIYADYQLGWKTSDIIETPKEALFMQSNNLNNKFRCFYLFKRMCPILFEFVF